MANFNIKTAVRQTIMARIPMAEEMDKSLNLDAHIGYLMNLDLESYQFGAKTKRLGLHALQQRQWMLRDVIQEAATDVLYNANTGGKLRFASKLDAIELFKNYLEALGLKYSSQFKNMDFDARLPWYSDFTKIGENEDGDPLFQRIEFWDKEEFLQYTQTRKFKVGCLRKQFDGKFELLRLPALKLAVDMHEALLMEPAMRMFRGAMSRKADRYISEGKIDRADRDIWIKSATAWVVEGANPGELGTYVHTVGAFIKAYNRAVESVIAQIASYSHQLANPRLVGGPAGSTPRYQVGRTQYEAPNVDTLISNLGKELWRIEAHVIDWMDAVRRILPDNLLGAIDQPLHGGFDIVDPDAVEPTFIKRPFDVMSFPEYELELVGMYDYAKTLEHQRRRQESYIRSKQRGLKEAMATFGSIEAPWM